MSVMERLKVVFARVFEVSVANLSDDTSPADIPAWDSMNHVNLISALEDEFDITFKSYDIQDLETIGKICAYIESEL